MKGITSLGCFIIYIFASLNLGKCSCSAQIAAWPLLGWEYHVLLLGLITLLSNGTCTVLWMKTHGLYASLCLYYPPPTLCAEVCIHESWSVIFLWELNDEELGSSVCDDSVWISSGVLLVLKNRIRNIVTVHSDKGSQRVVLFPVFKVAVSEFLCITEWRLFLPRSCTALQTYT